MASTLFFFDTMIYNYAPIIQLIDFTKQDNKFIPLTVVRRAKDHPCFKVTNRVIQTYMIRCKEDLTRLMPEVVMLCEFYGARAYIDVRPRTNKDACSEMLMKMAQNTTSGNYGNLLSSAASALAKSKPMKKIYLIDIDDLNYKEAVLRWLDINQLGIAMVSPEERTYLLADVKTVQGCHLLVTPFNRRAFVEEFPNVNVHANSVGTLLYYPDSLSPNKSNTELFWMTYYRDVYKIDLNITAHPEGYYTWEAIQMPLCTQLLETRSIDGYFPTYYEALKSAVHTIGKQLFGPDAFQGRIVKFRGR